MYFIVETGSMNTNKKAALHLAELCVQKGVTEVILSPGSRCAPLVIAFNRHPEIKCYTITDERSAAFFAMGIAQLKRKPVAIVCTSGTATLNYAPAIAEAYYQNIPLLVLTSDRPPQWIDQGDMQSIRQDNVFENYIKKSFSLPTNEGEEDMIYVDRIICEAINQTQFLEAGPVHINIPFNEPLYDLEEINAENVKCIELISTEQRLPEAAVFQLKEELAKTKKIMVLCGLISPNEKINALINELSRKENVAIFTETTSNLNGPNLNTQIDKIIDGVLEEELEKIQPDLVISLGGIVVSKKIKVLLRKNKNLEHWHVNPIAKHWDTYNSLTKLIPSSPEKFLESIIDFELNIESSYRQDLININTKKNKKAENHLNQVDFCDLKAYDLILKNIPTNSILQLGNSTPVRYSNLFEYDQQLTFYSNRGVGGIDGCLSTAVGMANETDKLVVAIIGDLSLAYDSNGFWNNYFPKNLKIILINNDGGNIFRIIKGPSSIDELGDFFETKNNISFENLAATYNIGYEKCEDEKELKECLNTFFDINKNKTQLLEIKTPGINSAEVLRNYFSELKLTEKT